MNRKHLYDMIYKRKSFHSFPKLAPLDEEEKRRVEALFDKVEMLSDRYKVKFYFSDNSDTSSRITSNSILCYSNKEDGYLVNVGYALEQLDLMVEGLGIGACWYGFGRAVEKVRDGLSFIDMINIGHVEEDSFRHNLFSANRKEVSAYWTGALIEGVSDIARYAPSACNTQSWKVEHFEDRLIIKVNRKTRSIIPPSFKEKFDLQNVGIYMLFIEICLENEGYDYSRSLLLNGDDIAEYRINKKSGME